MILENGLDVSGSEGEEIQIDGRADPMHANYDSDEAAEGPRCLSLPRNKDALHPFSALPYPILDLSSADASGFGGDVLQTRSQATLNLVNNLLGAGLLTMPYALAKTGLFTGLLLMALVAVANRYTLLLVLEMSERLMTENGKEFSYPEIGRRIFGQQGLLVVLAAYLVFTSGILTAYIVALTDMLKQGPVWLAGLPHLSLVVVAVLLCTPGAMLRSLQKIASLSALCMAGACMLVVVLAVVCVSDVISPPTGENAPIDIPGRHSDVDLLRFDLPRMLDGASLFALQFSVQAGGIEVLSRVEKPEEGEAGMQDASSLPAARAVSKAAFWIAGMLSATIATTAYLRYGDKVDGDVLLSFAATAPNSLLKVAQVAYGFVVTCSFAFIMVPCRFAVLDVFALRRRAFAGDSSIMPELQFRRVTVGILVTCGIFAWLVPDLAKVLQFVGVWATTALAFVLPSVFAMEMERREEGRPYSSPENLRYQILCGFGASVAIICSVNFLLEFADSHSTGARGHRVVVHDLRHNAVTGGNAHVGMNGSFLVN